MLMMPYQLTCVQYCIHQLTTLCSWSEPTARATCWQNWTSRRRIEQCSSDQKLLGVFWQNNIYIYKALPFGLRSSPNNFSALTADAMMWILNDRGVSAAIHYLHDSLLVGPADSPTCALSTTLGLCTELGFPVAPEKKSLHHPHLSGYRDRFDQEPDSPPPGKNLPAGYNYPAVDGSCRLPYP